MFKPDSCPDAWVMLRPATAYAGLADTAGSPRNWRSALARPLFAAFVLGCAVSLAASGRITLRLAIPATLYWTFIPLFGIGALALVAGGACRRIGWSRALDLFSTGNAAWSLMTLAYIAAWAFLPPIQAFATAGNSGWMTATLCFVLAWSAWIDFCFFRFVLKRTPMLALRDLALHRAVSWMAILVWFVVSAGVQVVRTALGL